MKPCVSTLNFVTHFAFVLLIATLTFACGDDDPCGSDSASEECGAPNGSTRGDVGDRCSADADCRAGNVCVALSNLKTACPGRVCTNQCTSDSQCTAFGDGDCDTVGSMRVCLFGEWEDETLCADY